MSNTTPNSAIPDLVFTVAITGHRALPDGATKRLEEQVAALLESIGAELLKGQSQSALDCQRATALRFVSALAPGADMIGARAALAAPTAALAEPRWSLNVLLPFAKATYAQIAQDDLRERGADESVVAQYLGDLADFYQKTEQVLELADWAPGSQDALTASWRARRYATLGGMLVRQADLLIAIWDGEPPNGPGGTTDVISEARRSGVPVIWIDPKDGAVHSLVPDPGSNHLPASDLVARWRGAAPGTAEHARFNERVNLEAAAAIKAAIAQVLLGGDPERAVSVRRYLEEAPAELWLTKDETGDAQPGDRYRAYATMLYWFLNWPPRKMRRQRPGEAAPAALRSYPFVRARRDGMGRWRKVLRYPFGFGVLPDEPGTAPAAPLLAHAARADALATRLGNQYRSAYVWIFALAPVAVMCAVLSAQLKDWKLLSVLLEDWKPPLVVAELFTVGTAAAIFFRTRAHDPAPAVPTSGQWWRRFFPASQDTHQRWLDARLIAESQRSGQLLAWVGFFGRRPIEAAAGAVAPHGAAGHGHSKQAHAAPRTVWAPFYANAIAALPGLAQGGLAAGQPDVLSPPRLAELSAAAGKVIADQLAYHDLNHQRLEALNHRLDTFSLRAIVGAAVISAFYLVLWMVNLRVPGWAPWPALLDEHSLLHAIYKASKPAAVFSGAVLPAVAAAAAGIRFQGDFERFAMRSQETAARLKGLGERAGHIAARAQTCGAAACRDEPPLFEPLLGLLLDTQAVLDEDLADWRFAYSARPITFG